MTHLRDRLAAGSRLDGTTLAELCARDVSVYGTHFRELVRAGIVVRGYRWLSLVLEGVSLSGVTPTELHDAGVGVLSAHVPDMHEDGVDVSRLRGARLRVAHLDTRMAAAVGERGQYLSMRQWHSDCGTAHCRAGWAVTLAGEAGRDAEIVYGTPRAAEAIYQASYPGRAIPDWYQVDYRALHDILRLAAEEKAHG